jgi:predicted 3-demethylubiquinone-9 3-methyltransferase (glyoxalase superfamily)
MQKLTPFLWFDHNAEEAVKFYLSVFKKGKIRSIARYTDVDSAPPSWPTAGTVMTVSFQLFGQDFVALNGGPVFHFNEAISFVVNCKTQREVDYYWSKLTAGGGKASQCGWLKDKYGVSWQIVPTALMELMSSKDRAKVARVTQAMLRMTKLDIKTLKQAATKRA